MVLFTATSLMVLSTVTGPTPYTRKKYLKSIRLERDGSDQYQESRNNGKEKKRTDSLIIKTCKKCLKHKKGDMGRSKLYTQQEDKKLDRALIKAVQD